jgi:hypothetical protein
MKLSPPVITMPSCGIPYDGAAYDCFTLNFLLTNRKRILSNIDKYRVNIIVIYYHDQVLSTVHNNVLYFCMTGSIVVCLYQHHHKHVNNSL